MFPHPIGEDQVALSDTEWRLLADDDTHLYPWELWGTAARGAGTTMERPDGSGFVIAIIDTGIKCDHMVFQSSEKILPESKSFISKTIDDTDGHGTMCAGIAAGDVVDTKYSGGVASKASLLICKVSNTRKDFWLGKVIDALEYIEEIHKQKSIHVVSMSFGFTKKSSRLERCINRLKKLGIICVAAAGNSGNTPGVPVRYPALYDNCISIGAHDSNWNCAGYCAEPGRHKIECTTLGVDVCASSTDTMRPLGAYSGTSVATAVAAGLVVGILQREFGSDLETDKLEDVKKSLERMIDKSNPAKPLWSAYTFTTEPDELLV